MILELFQLLDEITDNPDMEPEREQFRIMVHQFFGSWEKYENADTDKKDLEVEWLASELLPILTPFTQNWERREVLDGFIQHHGRDKILDALQIIVNILGSMVIQAS